MPGKEACEASNMSEAASIDTPAKEESGMTQGAFAESFMGFYASGKAATMAAAEQAKIAGGVT